MAFRDRTDAGRQLARKLARERERHPIVMALPLGGVPVAYEVARLLDAPLDVVAVRNVRAPGSHLTVGAVAEGGQIRIDRELALGAGITPADLEALVAREQHDAQRWAALLRSGRALADVRGRAAIVVDEGATTGARAVLAARTIRALAPSRLVLAVPVASRIAVELVRPEFDELVCLDVPPRFIAVGYWYSQWTRNRDEVVLDLLARRMEPAPPPPRPAGDETFASQPGDAG